MLYGGESSRLQSHQEDAVYVLDVNSLKWTSYQATGVGPGPRSLHQSTVCSCFTVLQHSSWVTATVLWQIP